MRQVGNRLRIAPARAAGICYFVANGMMFATWVSSIPRIVERLHLSPAELAIATCAISLGSIVVMLRIGSVIERYGARSVSAVAALGALAVLPCLTESQSYPLLLAFGVAFGVIFGAMDVAINSYVVAAEHDANTSWLSQMHGFWSLGNVAGSLMMATLVARTWPLPGVISSLGTLCVLLVAIRSASPAIGYVPEKARAVYTTALYVLGVSAAFGLLIEGAMGDWGALYLERDVHVAQHTAILGYAIFALAMTVARFTGDAMILRFGRAGVFTISTLLAAIGFVAALQGANIRIAVAGFAIVGFGCANIAPVLFGAGGRQAGAKGIALVSAIGYIAFFAGPALIGGTAQIFGLHHALYLVCACALILAFASVVPSVRRIL